MLCAVSKVMTSLIYGEVKRSGKAEELLHRLHILCEKAVSGGARGKVAGAPTDWSLDCQHILGAAAGGPRGLGGCGAR